MKQKLAGLVLCQVSVFFMSVHVQFHIHFGRLFITDQFTVSSSLFFAAVVQRGSVIPVQSAVSPWVLYAILPIYRYSEP